MKRGRLKEANGPPKRRRLKEARGPIRRRGWLAMLLAVGFTLFGLAFGLAEYFIAAAVFAIVLLIAAWQAIWQRPQFTLICGDVLVERRQVRQVLLKAYNPRPWSFFPLRLRLFLQKEGQEPSELACFEAALKPKEEKSLSIDAICPHRGEYAVYLHQYLAEDVFGFFALPGPALPPQKLLSLPRMDLTTLEERHSALFESEETQQKRLWQHGQLTAESRTYQQGDALRTIHWKKSASRRELMSRLREHTTDQYFCLLLDSRPWGEGEEALDYEDSLCEAALSFLFTLLAENQAVTLLPGALSIQSAQNMEKAAELLATLPFSADAVYGELESLLEAPNLPTELYIALAQAPAPLLPLLEKIVERGCPVVLLAPTAHAASVQCCPDFSLPVIMIND